MKSDEKLRVAAWLEILTGIGLFLFWIGFFTIGLAPETPPPCYFAYEHSFPLPDIVLALVLLIAGKRILRKDFESGVDFSLLAAGGLVFLGLLDFSFNLQNGVYAISIQEAAMNLFINFWCIGFGAVLSVLMMKNR